MTEALQTLWSDDTLLLYLGMFSLFFFLLTLIIIPWLILQIPEDYFQADKRHSLLGSMQHPVIQALLLVSKNLLGVFFLLLGVLLLVLPGQGLLTILLGIILIDFPGKYRLQRWFVRQESVLRSVNWLRKKGKRPPIQL